MFNKNGVEASLALLLHEHNLETKLMGRERRSKNREVKAKGKVGCGSGHPFSLPVKGAEGVLKTERSTCQQLLGNGKCQRSVLLYPHFALSQKHECGQEGKLPGDNPMSREKGACSGSGRNSERGDRRAKLKKRCEIKK